MLHAKFYLRMDTDSCFKGPLPDVFALMRQQPGLDYIANEEIADSSEVTVGLESTALEFAQQQHLALPLAQPLVKPNAHGQRSVLAYTNNFEVVRLQPFRQSATFAAWEEAVARSNGIYSHRWGDAVIRRLSLVLMGSNVTFLRDVAPEGTYKHSPCMCWYQGVRRWPSCRHNSTRDLA